MLAASAVLAVSAPLFSAPPSPQLPARPAPAPIRCEVRAVGFDQVRAPGTAVEPGPGVVAGALYGTRVDVDFDRAPLSQALPALARAVRINLLPLFRPRDDMPGLDRDAIVSLALTNVTAVEAIESMLAASTGMVDATWQIRGSIVECGPKAMLAESSRRETRVYDITDIHFEIPTFSHPAFDPDRVHDTRRTKQEISADLATMIVNQVEPDAWREPDAPSPDGPGGRSLGTPTGAAPTPAKNLDPRSDEEIFVRGQWASLHIRDHRTLVIVAPDFIHRRINGYPGMVPPEAHSGATGPLNPPRRAPAAPPVPPPDPGP